MEKIVITSGKLRLPGLLTFKPADQGLVIFAHGSGSSRLSPRNQFVASRLNAAGIATLLFDLLTPAESENRYNIFAIALLTERLVVTTQCVKDMADLARLPLGFFGASTGAAAALAATADLDGQISAVVSRGGRPDLALAHLPKVTAPVLLIVGGADHEVLELNREAAAVLPKSKVVVVPRATGLHSI